jgi:hypothetical protein
MQQTIVERLEAEADAIHDRIILIQKQCSHPLVVRETVNKGDTGNWDRGQDSYWAEHKCGLCGRRWQTEQNWERTGDGRGTPKERTEDVN